jgi:hypothetical protein
MARQAGVDRARTPEQLESLKKTDRNWPIPEVKRKPA